jgi:hypothetical protein
MLKKILYVLLLFILLPILAHSQIELGLRLGAGLKNDHDSDYKRYRMLFGIDGATNLFKQDGMFLGMAGEGEFSYRWYDYESNDDVTNHYVKFLFDLRPEVGLLLAEVIKPSFGAGPTFGFDVGKYEEQNNWDYELSKASFLYGFNVQPGLAFIIEDFFAKAAIKYRYLFEMRHWERKERWEVWGGWGEYEDDGDDEYSVQSWDFVLSGGLVMGDLSFEGGIQFENWNFKHEDWDDWPDWPDVWEIMLFAKVITNM